MQGSFEKKIQEKLDELKLNPSAPVWDEIERQIRPERKRRRGVFWLFFFAGLLIAGGWWLFTQKAANETTPLSKTEDSVTKSINEKQQVSETKQFPKKLNRQSVQKNNVSSKSIDAFKNIISFSAQRLIVSKNITEKNGQYNDNLLDKQREQIAVDKEGYSPDDNSLEIEKEKNIVDGKNASVKTHTLAIEEKPSSSVLQSVPNADSIAQAKKEAPKRESSTNPDDSAKRKVAVVRKKWSNRILFSAGWSSVASLNSSFNFAALPNYSTGGQVNNGSSYQPAKVNKGFAFSIGYAREKKLSDHLAISVGLQYAYYSTHQKVGSFKTLDTTILLQDKNLDINGYYGNPFASNVGNMSGSISTIDYTSHFHVIEIPFALHYRLLKSRPLQFAAGVSYGRLLSSNALSFDAASGVYYKSKENNRKNYLNTFFALQYDVVNKSAWKLSLGPVIQYNALSLQKVSSGKRHLLFTGIGTAVEF